MADVSRLPQVLPPGLPTSAKPFTGDYEICWSIYVQCTNLRKLREVHIPALEALIGQPHGGKGWLYENENYNESRDRSLKRIIAVQSVKGPYTDQLLLAFMKTLYSLSSFWTIQARLNPSHPQGVYVSARFQRENPGSEAPAVVDALVELEANFTDAQGHTFGRSFGKTRRISAAVPGDSPAAG
ncbi:hypothetical protein FJ987_01580 [Mesorhizobium sp. CU2]|uniref:hypothetical protein n=1 Tax=unclassified Mesorhizobium TaxID=325217 RepID=UPI00112A9122|nr:MULTISPECIES: hypothetical protein [unclassified Mesorhizobium]TPN88532.1 hypothetical protein FJ988_05665 [Mesorhizobium sp. CU3]TPO21530.1 hypothetical protein FJ987_01580 [Mesorhizobium sp. CU2]